MAVQSFIAVIYLVVSAAAGVAAFRFLGLSPLAAAGLGGAGAFVCALAHGAILTALRLRRLGAAQAALAGTVADTAETLENTRRDLDHFKRVAADASERRHHSLLAEVKVLQTLLGQVVQGRSDAVQRRDAGLDQPPSADVEHMSDDEIFTVMRNALDGNRVDLHLQPIVQLPSRRPWSYECFSRVRDAHGDIIYPSAYLDIAAARGLVGTLDNLLLFRCIQMIRQLGHRRPGVRFFFNISSASLEDGEFFPSFVDFMLDNGALASRLVFEFRYGDLARFSPALLDELGRLADAGFAFSADHVETANIDPALLARRFISFLKVDAATLLKGQGDIHMADFKAMLKRFDITLIATKIEDERTIVDILDLNVDYGQGYLLGEPKPSRNPAEAAA